MANWKAAEKASTVVNWNADTKANEAYEADWARAGDPSKKDDILRALEQEARNANWYRVYNQQCMKDCFAAVEEYAAAGETEAAAEALERAGSYAKEFAKHASELRLAKEEIRDRKLHIAYRARIKAGE